MADAKILVHKGLVRAALAAAGAFLLLAGAQATPPNPATPAAAMAQEAAAPAGAYVLTPDDQLEVSVQGHEELRGTVTILPDGTFNYPIVGTVHAAGLTVAQLTDTMTAGIGRQLNQPLVTVLVKESRPRKVSVLGAVKTPGMVDYKTGWRVLDALAACGGAAQENALINATLVTSSGRKSIPLDFVKLMSGTDTEQNLALSPGDILLMETKDPTVAQVQVVGEVAKPGLYIVPSDGAPLLSLLTQAGGATPKAALTRAQVLHQGQVTPVNLRPLMSSVGDASGGVKLVAGDVLEIPTNKARFGVLGEVRAPAAYDLPDGETFTATDALLLAGGPNNDGDKKNVALIRRGPDGKSVVITMNLDTLPKGDLQARNQTVQDGDILFVPTRHKGRSVGDQLGALGPIAVLANLLRL